MAFLDNLSKKLNMVSQEVASQTTAFAEQTRINAKISDEERQISAYFTQLGKAYFDDHKNDPNPEYSNIITDIKDAMHRIDIYKADIRRAKGLVKCPQCGADVSVNVPYCSYCGGQLPKQEYTDSADSKGGIDGLGDSVLNHDGSYATPNNDGTALNYESSTTLFDLNSLDIEKTNLTPNSNAVSLEKKDTFHS